MARWIFTPPAAFAIILLVATGLTYWLRGLSCCKRKTPDDSGESYACGEENYNHMAQPDYSNFFPFAFFFTLAHVATLIMATVIVGTPKVLAMAIVYLIAAIIGLYILLRR
jgi:NADH:ubiquinone oxidoreductase subunit 3 (subunit A)